MRGRSNNSVYNSIYMEKLCRKKALNYGYAYSIAGGDRVTSNLNGGLLILYPREAAINLEEDKYGRWQELAITFRNNVKMIVMNTYIPHIHHSNNSIHRALESAMVAAGDLRNPIEAFFEDLTARVMELQKICW